MADRVVSWKVVADFAAVRKEAESAKRAIDDLRTSEADRDKESQARQKKRASEARKLAAASGGGGGGGGKDTSGTNTQVS